MQLLLEKKWIPTPLIQLTIVLLQTLLRYRLLNTTRKVRPLLLCPNKLREARAQVSNLGVLIFAILV